MAIVVFQLINYTLSFLMWMIVGQAFLSRIVGDRRNVMVLAFARVTEPVYGVTRMLLPFVKGAWVPVVSFFLIVAIRLAMIILVHPASGR